MFKFVKMSTTCQKGRGCSFLSRRKINGCGENYKNKLKENFL